MRGEVFDDRRAVFSDSEGRAFVQGRLCAVWIDCTCTPDVLHMDGAVTALAYILKMRSTMLDLEQHTCICLFQAQLRRRKEGSSLDCS